LHNPSTQKKALNGLKRSVGDAHHPSGLISFLTFWGAFAWAQCYVHIHGFSIITQKFGNSPFKQKKRKKKGYPTT
jgi:hypothetical protein